MSTVFSWSSHTDSFNDTTVGSAPSVVSGGSYGERLVWPSTTAQAFQRETVTALGDFAQRIIYTIASYAGSSHSVFQGFATGNVQQFRVDIANTGLLRLRDGSLTQVAVGTHALLVNTEYHFEILRSGSTMTVKVYTASSGVLLDTISGTVGSTALVLVEYGNNAALTGTLGSFTMDELVLTNVGTVEVGPPTPLVSLTASAVVSPSSGAPPFTLTLTITATGGSGTYLYEVDDWGDGSTSAQQSSNVFTKAITTGATTGAKTISYKVTG